MKVVRLEASNVLRLRAVDISPEGDTVVISGRNAQGKSSILNSIWLALGGGAATKDVERPIRDGEDSASIRLDLGDIVVTRTFSADGKTKLKVQSAEGATYPSPQTMLDDLVGRLSFDPLAFAQQDSKTQLATLLGLVELSFNPAELEESRRQHFENRTDVNRRIKTLQANLEAQQDLPDDLPDEEISTAELLAEFRAAQEVETANRALRGAAEEAKTAIVAAGERVERLLTELAEAETALETAHLHAQEALGKAANLQDPDLDAYTPRLASAEETNRQVREAKARKVIQTELKAAQVESASITETLELIQETKTEGLKEAKMPLEGLAFDDSGVTYQDVPFKQCSSAEQLRVSVAMAMALNPQVRVILIRDGSLLDADNLALIEEMAGKRSYQVWVEKVSDSGDVGIVIEDGAVVAIDGQEV